MYTTLKLTFEDKIATLTLSRADKRNAISHAMLDEFLAALQEVEHSSAQVLIVAAEGKAFCAGMDLEDLQAMVTQTAEENLPIASASRHFSARSTNSQRRRLRR